MSLSRWRGTAAEQPLSAPLSAPNLDCSAFPLDNNSLLCSLLTLPPFLLLCLYLPLNDCFYVSRAHSFYLPQALEGARVEALDKTRPLGILTRPTQEEGGLDER